MFDVGWSEIGVIAVVALVVIGPKDLPVALRTVGQYVRKARKMAAEFQSSIDEMGRELELEELRKKMNAAAMAQPAEMVEKLIDPKGELAEAAHSAQAAAAEVKSAMGSPSPMEIDAPSAPPSPMPELPADIPAASDVKSAKS